MRINKVLAIFDEEGPNIERSSNVTGNVLSSVRCYSNVLKEIKIKTSQRSLDYYFKAMKKGVTNPNFRKRGLPTQQLTSCLA